MKSKLSKIILFALIAVLLFGAMPTMAYESYDTYTYSIDGEPLKSPAAYTPDFTTYDSEKMGLLSGNHWAYDEDGKLGYWSGMSMQPKPFTESFTSEGLSYVLNADGESYTVTGYENSDLYKAVKALADAALAIEARYPAVDGDQKDVVTVSVTFNTLSAYAAKASKTLSKDNFVEILNEAAEAAVAKAKEDANGKTITVTVKVDEVALANRFVLLSAAPQVYLHIPDTYTGADGEAYPVTAIAAGAFDDPLYAPIFKMFIKVLYGANVTEIGENAFADCTVATFYTYSEGVKFGNTALNLAGDMVTDNDGNVYVVDRGNNRIVVLNKRDFKTIGVIGEYVDNSGHAQALKNPSGMYVTNPDEMVDGSSEIFICDTDNKRIVVFDREFNYLRTIKEPTSPLLDHDDFQLHAIAVDIYGRIFAISHNCYQGVIVLSGNGDFTGFIGAQKVTVDPIKQLWNKYFTTAEQRESDIKNLSKPFNNITVDYSGFVYVTINFTEPADLKNQLASIKSKTSNYSPVKKLNSTGVEIMKRNGFFDPGGEVVLSTGGATAKDLSVIIDVAVGNEGSWSLLDSSRSRIFTYDSNGNLLFAFGDKGDQVGNGENYVAMTYQVIDGIYNMVLLDNSGTGYKLIVYHPTDYCDTIMSALHNENVHNHSATIDDWQDVLTRNNNFDLAYIGIGKALYNQGNYEQAMKMLSSSYETEYYSKAFSEVRKGILAAWMIPLIIALIAVLFLFFKFLGWAKKKNKATSLKVGRKTYGEEMLYICHLIFHPFDGFWDLKHEKRGSVRAATTILGVTIVAFFYQAIGQGYMFNPRGDYSTVFLQVIAVLVPVLLWVISNWCLTTLFDGEGGLADIYIATCYSLAPLPVFVILSTILTNVFTVSEGSMVTLLVSIGYVWVGLLLFFGMSVTHDYSTGKNLITVLGTIVAMCVIMFIAILFSSLVIKMVTFIVAIITEIVGRF